jgi:hypothetical protein
VDIRSYIATTVEEQIQTQTQESFGNLAGSKYVKALTAAKKYIRDQIRKF